jgi:hypothetical protein
MKYTIKDKLIIIGLYLLIVIWAIMGASGLVFWAKFWGIIK